MPPESIVMLEKLMNKGFEGIEKLQREIAKKNDEAHDRFDAKFKVLNGQTARNSNGRIKQAVHNRWIYGLVISVALPVTFLFIKSFI